MHLNRPVKGQRLDNLAVFSVPWRFCNCYGFFLIFEILNFRQINSTTNSTTMSLGTTGKLGSISICAEVTWGQPEGTCQVAKGHREVPSRGRRAKRWNRWENEAAFSSAGSLMCTICFNFLTKGCLNQWFSNICFSWLQETFFDEFSVPLNSECQRRVNRNKATLNRHVIGEKSYDV